MHKVKIFKYGLLCAAATMLASAVQAEGYRDYQVGDAVEAVSFGLVKTDLDYSKTMFDRQDHVTDKVVQQLQYRQQGKVHDASIYLGGRFIGQHFQEWTDTAGKFPIISRLPGQHTKGNHGTESVIADASVDVTITPLPWLTLFAQGEYTEIEYPGQDDKQLRKFWVTVGDLSQYPVYATFGRNTVNFGNFASYAPFTHNHSSHYFWAQSEDPHLEVGYVKDGWQVAASLIPSHRGNRVLNTPDRDGWKNVALAARKSFHVQDDVTAEIGGGFLRGTIYDSTLAHHPPSAGAQDNEWNPAFNAHGTLSFGDYLDVMAEYTRTADAWPATDYPVSSLTLQTRYKHDVYDMPGVASFMYSRGEQGADGTEWEDMQQTVLGYELEVHPNVSLGAEYLYNSGFVPLIMPLRTGDKSVDTHSVIVGVKATF